MSALDQYPRVSTVLKEAEAQRQDADAINYLLSNVATIDDRVETTETIITLQILISREFAVLTGNTGTFASGATITGWSGGGVDDPDSLIAANSTNGSITIGADGLYVINLSMIITGTANNVDFDLFAHANGGAGVRIGYVFQPSQAANGAITVVGYREFIAGDVVTFSITGAGYTLELAQISLALKTPDLQAA